MGIIHYQAAGSRSKNIFSAGSRDEVPEQQESTKAANGVGEQRCTQLVVQIFCSMKDNEMVRPEGLEPPTF